MCLVSFSAAFLCGQPAKTSCVCTDIANYIYEHPGSLDLNLKGIWISDRMSTSFSLRNALLILSLSLAAFGWDVIQTQLGAANFMHRYESNFALKYVILSAHADTIISLIH